MNKKIFENARFTPKGDIEANWKKATGFVPLDKEIIIYKPDEEHTSARMKIGDGKTGINDLPFMVPEIEIPEIEIPEQVQADWAQNDENSVDYVKNRTHWVEQIENYILWEGVLSEDAPGYPGELQFYKVSDAILNPLGYVVTIAGNEYTITINEMDTGLDYIMVFADEAGLLMYAGTSDAISRDWGLALTGGTYIVDNMSFAYGETISIRIPNYEVVHKLDNKFIPTPDWNQSDKTGDGYIKNRTHWEVENGFTWEYDSSNFRCMREHDEGYWCGIQIKSIASIADDIDLIGSKIIVNDSITNIISDVQIDSYSGKKTYTCQNNKNKYWFTIADNTSSGFYQPGIYLEWFSTYREPAKFFDRLEVSNTIHKLDSKYLDETTVAFKTDLEAVKSEINETYSNAVTTDENGNVVLAGTVYVGGTSQDDAKVLITAEDAANQDAVVLAEAQKYTDEKALLTEENLASMDVVVLAEAQKYTDTKIAELQAQIDELKSTIAGLVNASETET